MSSPGKAPGVRVATKSGTAQVGSKSQPRQIAWFIGFFPVENPRYTFAVMIEGEQTDDLHGGGDAGMVAGNIFRELYAPTVNPVETAEKNH